MPLILKPSSSSSFAGKWPITKMQTGRFFYFHFFRKPARSELANLLWGANIWRNGVGSRWQKKFLSSKKLDKSKPQISTSETSNPMSKFLLSLSFWYPPSRPSNSYVCHVQDPQAILFLNSPYQQHSLLITALKVIKASRDDQMDQMWTQVNPPAAKCKNTYMQKSEDTKMQKCKNYKNANLMTPDWFERQALDEIAGRRKDWQVSFKLSHHTHTHILAIFTASRVCN